MSSCHGNTLFSAEDQAQFLCELGILRRAGENRPEHSTDMKSVQASEISIWTSIDHDYSKTLTLPHCFWQMP